METNSNKLTILIAIDGSPQALFAFEYYLANFHKSNMRLILMCAAEAKSEQLEVGTCASLWDHLPEKDADKIKELEDQYKNKLKHLKIDGHFEVVLTTKPEEAICKRALAEQCSLIVIGSRGLNLIRRTILGSVSEFVVHHAHCPVLICRQEGSGIQNVCGPV